jgi:hypothetical protein
MGNKVYVPPKRNVRIKTKSRARISSSHQRPYNKDTKPAQNRATHPDEAQQEAAAELNPAYVNPDGSINFWATLNTKPDTEPSIDDEQEDK